MADIKDKAPRAKTPREKEQRFDPSWNGKTGTVASEAEYCAKIRERPGFYRGAKIRNHK